MTSKQYLVSGVLFTVLGLVFLVPDLLGYSKSSTIDFIAGGLCLGCAASDFYYRRQIKRQEQEKENSN